VGTPSWMSECELSVYMTLEVGEDGTYVQRHNMGLLRFVQTLLLLIEL
jgi:hypothetical protein